MRSPVASKVVVRTALPCDEKSARSVFEAAFGTVRRIYRPKGDVLAHEARRAQLGTRLVAVLDGTVVGTVQIAVHSEHVHLIGLAVLPDVQGQGVAGRLISHVAAMALGLGRAVLALDTIRETGNVATFEAMGWRVVSETLTDKFESDTLAELHEVKMERGVWSVERPLSEE
jgi:GNAT superfamily N-acetyltransferase